MSRAEFAPLRPGDTVAVFAPGGFMTPERLAPGEAEIRCAGFVPLIHPQCLLREGRFAGPDQARAQALHDLYQDKTVRAVICARGGYGSNRFVDLVDFSLIAANPKPLVGYSDATTLLNAITQRTGQVAFLGPMVGDFTRSPPNPQNAENWAYLWRLLKGEPCMPAQHPATAASRTLVAGEAEGKLVGGNLSILASECGTPTQLKTVGAILLLEELSEDLYRFDRLLWQFKRAGLLDNLKGVVLADLVGVADKGEPAFGQTVEEIVLSHVGQLGVPVVSHFPAGHGDGRVTLPLGASARLVASASGVSLTHEKVFCS